MEFHKALGSFFSNHFTIVFRTFQEAVEIPVALYLLQFMTDLSLHQSLSSLHLCLFAAQISLFMKPLTCCGVLCSCITQK